MLFLAILLFIYNFVDGYWLLHVCSVFNDIYSKMFIFGLLCAIMTENEHNFGLEASPCNSISEGRPPLRNTSSEAVALPLEVRIEHDSGRKFSQSIFS